MRALFQGTFTNRIDAKGRVSIPAPFRRVLEKNDPEWVEGLNPHISILFDWPGRNCLEAYSVSAMNELMEKILQLPSRSKKRQLYSRLVASNSQQFQLDDGGRLLLPKHLFEKAGIEGEATFASMIDSFEIWKPENYAGNLEATLADYDEIIDEDDPFGELS